MKFFFFYTFVAVLHLGLVRGLDVKCTPHGPDDTTTCAIKEPVTLKTDEKVNIVSNVNLNSINKIAFGSWHDGQFHISTVPKEIFEQLPNLEIFQLHATVRALNKGDFEKASKLKDLLIENQLKRIPAGVLGSAKNLETLTLSDNRIAQIEDNAFNGLNALLKLDLDSNKLTIIKQNTFNGLEKLEHLDLDANQIKSIEENALNLPNLKVLHVRFNKLTSLPDNLFSATPLLQEFRAGDNRINQICKSLYGLKYLETFSISENLLTDVDFVVFSQMLKLKELSLNKNLLTSGNISKIAIKEPSNSVLSSLSLYDNKLTNNDDWKKFAIFPQLEFIDVENNKYSKIDLGDKTLHQQFPKLKTMYISAGEWNCDWLKSFIESSKKDGIDIWTSFPNTDGKNVNDIGCV